MVCLAGVLLVLVALRAVDAAPSGPVDGSPGKAVNGSPGCITRDVFGSYPVPEQGGQQATVYRYTLDNGQMSVQVVEYGATITSIKVPDRQGRQEDIVLGYDTLEGYLSADNPYFGATVGRVASLVTNAQFSLDGVKYNVTRNNGKHSIHGGKRGFDKKLWSGRTEGCSVVLEYTSPDGEEGYPGQVKVTVVYSLTSDSTLVIEYRASSTKRTPINLINHAYFNLAGQGAGAAALYNHSVMILSDTVVEITSDGITTGRLLPVSGMETDLRQETSLGAAINRTSSGGFDFNYVLQQDRQVETVVARVSEPSSGRQVKVSTSQPSLIFYTANSISSIEGKSRYTKHAGFCLETLNYVDAVNHPQEFPNSVYGPGDEYHQRTQYKFGLTSV